VVPLAPSGWPPAKNAEAYGDSLAIESLIATVLVEFPLSKGRIALHFRPRPFRLNAKKFN
jgi:hypothetical protein